MDIGSGVGAGEGDVAPRTFSPPPVGPPVAEEEGLVTRAEPVAGAVAAAGVGVVVVSIAGMPVAAAAETGAGATLPLSDEILDSPLFEELLPPLLEEPPLVAGAFGAVAGLVAAGVFTDFVVGGGVASLRATCVVLSGCAVPETPLLKPPPAPMPPPAAKPPPEDPPVRRESVRPPLFDAERRDGEEGADPARPAIEPPGSAACGATSAAAMSPVCAGAAEMSPAAIAVVAACAGAGCRWARGL
jgi:hypothetical protein